MRSSTTHAVSGTAAPRAKPVARTPPVKLPARFRVGQEIGRGGMGVVYRATDLTEQRSVAVKTLSVRKGLDLVALLRFEREARTASSLSHPNICHIFEVDEYRGRPYIVMELLEGETLRSRIARGECDTALALGVAQQVARGLAAAHGKFIVHRDVKPSNVMLLSSGLVKILDFGLAKHFAGVDDSPTVTETGHTPGTVDYMSPEQFLGQRLDQRTDSLKGLHVAPWTLALRSREGSRGRQLYADRVLVGAVGLRNDQFVAKLTLLSADKNEPLWTKTYEVGAEHLIQLRDEVVRDVAAELRLEADHPIATRPARDQNRRAFQLCLKGRFFWSRRYEGGLQNALHCFEEAMRIDPHMAKAHAGVADTYSFLGFYSLIRPRSAFAKASVSAQQALRLDEELPEAHTSLGLVKLGGEWDWDGAVRHFERAVELDPGEGLARIYLSWAHVLLGHVPQAHQEAERAQDVDPLSPMLNAGAAYTFFLSRSYERSIRECEKALEIDKDFLVALYVLALSKMQLGLHRQAIPHLERAVTLSNGMPFYLTLLGKAYGHLHQGKKAHEFLRRIDALASAGTVYITLTATSTSTRVSVTSTPHSSGKTRRLKPVHRPSNTCRPRQRTGIRIPASWTTCAPGASTSEAQKNGRGGACHALDAQGTRARSEIRQKFILQTATT